MLKAGGWAVQALLVLSALDSFAAHPLITEDTGTQRPGRTQIELTTEHGYDREPGATERASIYSLVWSHGIHGAADLILTIPYQRVHRDIEGAVTDERGLSDLGAGLKWRFHEHGELSFALKPEVNFPTGDEARGLGAGRGRYGAFLVGTYAPAPWAFHLHLGLSRNRNKLDERENIRHVSAALWREFANGRVRVVADLGTDTATDKAVSHDPSFLILGLIYSVNDDFDLDIGYKKGLTDAETDRAWLAAVTVRF